MSDLYIFGYGSSGPSTIDISSATVTLGSSLTYNGTEQTQTVSVEVNGVTLTENTDYTITDNTATNAGSYTLSILGTGAYSGTKTASWSIAKAQGSINVSPNSLTIVGANSTGTATITSVGDGAISAVSSDTSVATVSVSGDTVTVTGVASGDATVTVTMADGQNYLGDSVSFNVSVMVISSTLAKCTPAEIQAATQLGIASSLWSVGDKTANISIKSFSGIAATTNVAAFIIGFDHNSSKEGTNRIHFQFGKIGNADVAFYSLKMNTSHTNRGGWNGSRMRTVICPAFKSALPSSWKNVIATTTKYTDNTGGGNDTASYVTSTSDGIFILAEYEVFGTQKYANSAEQNSLAQYQYYINGNSKLKRQHNATGTACFWWLRSPTPGNSTNFCGVSTSGYRDHNGAASLYGFAPAFCIA